MPTLDWLNRAQAFTTSGRVPYRLLEEVSVHTPTAKSGAPAAEPAPAQPAQAELLTVRTEPVEGSPVSIDATRTEITDNLLIQGDNLEALKALLPFYRGQVKCIFIDPPYNTKSAFEHYDDNLEHAQWLSMMLPRLQLLRELLREDGSIWVTIDDNEGHYLKVLMDEVFGRGNFVANVVWQKKYAVANDHKTIAPMHDHVLVYRQSARWQRNLLDRTDDKDRQYKHEDFRGVFRVSDYTCAKTAEERPNLYYPVHQPNTGTEIWPSKTRVWAYSLEEHKRHISEGFIYWGKDGKAKTPSYKRYKHLLKNDGVVPQTLWTHEFAGHTDGSRKEVREVLSSISLVDDFITPKPELLISRIMQAATDEGDLILDSFLGSGTTAAVAHKMGRRWIAHRNGRTRGHALPAAPAESHQRRTGRHQQGRGLARRRWCLSLGRSRG
jgi:adenine-specific DNA-methyltransferase